jgi:predicted AlkP superfamily phosphohydrolase/phosphomutase
MKMLVLGLDCAEPSLVFDRFQHDLPNLSRVAAQGISGTLTSVIPAITVPAWACGLTSRDPGQLGVYGFRNRKDHSYEGLAIANSTAIKAQSAIDILAQRGKKVIVQGVPPAYPPKPTNGVVVGCFLTPADTNDYTYPGTLKAELQRLVGDYPFDVKDFRTDDKQHIVDEVYEMTRKHFDVFRHLIRTREWDFAMLHEIGIDRIHHGFWKYMDESHPRHEPGNVYQDVIRDYYRFVDSKVGELLEDVPDGTDILVMSDHGAKKMDGGICVNEWLISEGLLTLKRAPEPKSRLDPENVDWSRTKVWGDGGYYARIFINVEGREPQGVVPQAGYEEFRDELAARLEAIRDEQGADIGTQVFKPEEIYREVNNVAPDLVVYFGDLAWRSVGSVGMESIYTYENDTGPDDANHAQDGLFMLSGAEIPAGQRLAGASILQTGPTILQRFGITPPAAMIARPLLN